MSELPPEVREMGVTDFVETPSGLFTPRTIDRQTPVTESLEVSRMLWPWMRRSLFSADQVRTLQHSVQTFSPAAADLLERVTDLVEYMTDYRPENLPGRFEYDLHDGLPILENTWRQWYFEVKKPCHLHVVITVEIAETPEFGEHPVWRYHVQNDDGRKNLKELTHRVRELRGQQGRTRHQFEVDNNPVAPTFRGIDL